MSRDIISDYSSEYRKKCLEAKGHECDACGSVENIQVHHIDENRENNDLDNLVPLCASCHKILHNCNLGLEELAETVDPAPDNQKTPQPMGSRKVKRWLKNYFISFKMVDNTLLKYELIYKCPDVKECDNEYIDQNMDEMIKSQRYGVEMPREGVLDISDIEIGAGPLPAVL